MKPTSLDKYFKRDEIPTDLSPMCSMTIGHLSECFQCREFVIQCILRVNAGMAGATKSRRKAAASRENGKLGGRPRKNK